jgi:hypothetical protein
MAPTNAARLGLALFGKLGRPSVPIAWTLPLGMDRKRAAGEGLGDAMIRKCCVAASALALAACATDVLPHKLGEYGKVGGANWSFVDGEARASSGTSTGYLVSTDDYFDFELELEIYVGDPHNSGVFVRCPDHTSISASACYEINVYDKRPDPSGRTGSVPGFFTPPLAHVDAAGKWNKVKIVAKGARLTVSFNDVTTVDGDGPLVNAGAIALQWVEGDIRFRNVRVKRL